MGSIIGLTDASGSLVESYEYDAYGKTRILDANGLPLNASAYGNRFGFTGREYDTETGLYFYRARYYDPTIGRFISQDPIGFAGGVNFYAYCGNHPISYLDPMGLCGEGGSLPYWAIATIGIVGDDATVIGIADDVLIPVIIVAVIINEARKFGQRGAFENPLPLRDAPGPDYWETSQGKNQPPKPGKEGWWIAIKIFEFIARHIVWRNK